MLKPLYSFHTWFCQAKSLLFCSSIFMSLSLNVKTKVHTYPSVYSDSHDHWGHFLLFILSSNSSFSNLGYSNFPCQLSVLSPELQNKIVKRHKKVPWSWHQSLKRKLVSQDVYLIMNLSFLHSNSLCWLFCSSLQHTTVTHMKRWPLRELKMFTVV